jgi:flagellar hook assembly protein FlgD
MRLNEDLSVEAMKQMARLLRSVQSASKRRFKLSDSEQVLKMVEFADASNDVAVTDSLSGFLEALPESKRQALASSGVLGAVKRSKAKGVTRF